MLRNRFGRFLKRGHKRKHKARRRGTHRKHARRRHQVRRRRRSNPHMLLANPSGSKQQLHLFGPRGETIRPQLISTIRSGAKRKRKGPKRAASRAPSVRRRHKRGRKYYRIYRGRGRSPKFRIFRRSNPFGAWGALVRLGLAGGLGIVTARIGGRLYTDHASKLVLGATPDPKSFRAILNEGLRIVAMGALPILVERHMLRHIPIVTGADRMAFQLGGLAEAGRQGIGVLIKKLKPGVDAGRWGLDGPMPYVQYHDDGATIFGLHPSGQWYAIGRSNGGGMNGLMQSDRFGMNGVMQADEFGMSGDDDGYDDVESA
jgi:hypothetical protein